MKPNVRYVNSNGYVFETDDLGRITSAQGDLKLGAIGERNEYAQKTVGWRDRQPSDNGGHLIGHQFGGPDDIDNLVAMDGNLNQFGPWKVNGRQH